MAHIPHPPTTLLHNPTTPTRPPCLKMKKSSSLSTKPFLSHQNHSHRVRPSLRSILVLTALTLYGLQSFLSHLNATIPRRSSYPASTSNGAGGSSSQTTFGVPFPTSEATHQRSSSSSRRRKQQHTYSPQEQREQQQTWYNDQTQQQHHQETYDSRTEFEKKYFSEPTPSYFPTSNDDDDYYSSSNYNNYDTQQADSFGAYDEYGAGTRQVVPGSECKGYYCAETDTCVDRPINCPCPHILDTKCFRSDWFVCFRGPHKC
ncbi:MAG: hypothetical protein JOS17DRAFT_740356 [Linnemannia elongata]|nr:MAG: hypothetical protein JOS17DRAFT_740356 [Linnemannia elongata]